jgi:proteic killer suppression protein
VIASFKSKALRALWETGKSAKLRPDLVERVRARLAILNGAKTLDALRLPGLDFHALHGRPRRYTVHVNGPWCITFEWRGSDALRVDLEQYH